MRLEPLEARFCLSAGGIEPAVSSFWFADVSDSSDPRHVNPASFSVENTADSEKVVLLNAASTGQFDWIVRFDTAALAEMSSLAETVSMLAGEGMQFQVLRGLGLVGQVLVRSSGASLGDVSDWLASNDCIANYELDLAYQVEAVPNDGGYSNLWGMDNSNGKDIDAEAAWNISTGSSDVVVGVIDTGVDYTHPDLAANIWTNPGEIAGNGLDDDHNGFVDDVHGYDFCNGDGNPMDDHSHGTHCAGTIAGVGNNGIGVAGVNWNSSIMALKFIDADGSGSLSDAVSAINYATMMRSNFGVNICVTSNSWGGGGYSSSMYDAIAAHNNAGILFVAAAGNSATNNDIMPSYPASYNLSGIVSVAATDSNDSLAYFSCYGASSVDIAAPGVNIYSTVAGGGYAYYSGTSMATPHVAGVAALAWSVAPDATLTEIREAILQGAESVASLSGKVATGGRLNAFNTLELLDASGPGAPYMSSLTVSPNPAEIGDTVALAASGLADSDGSVVSVSFYRDSNANGRFDETDALIGVDATIVNAQASMGFDTTGLESGNYLFFARALDNNSLYSRAYAAALSLTTPDLHGDDAASATLIQVGSTTDGEIQTAADVDWFKFQATAGWGYIIDTDLLNLDDSTLYLYDQNGTTLLTYNDDVSWPADPSSFIAWEAPADGIYFIEVTNYNSETGTYRLNLHGSDDMPPSPTYLGEVDFLEIDGLNPAGGDFSYVLQTAHGGYLTVEALFAGSDDDLEISLYDFSFNLLAVSTATSGGERLDWQVNGGELYYVGVSGSTSDLDLRLANLVGLYGENVYVFGTDGDDSFEFTASAMHRIAVNQVVYEFDPVAVNTIRLYGGWGTDTAVLYGSTGNETAWLSPAYAVLTGADYEVILAGSENNTIFGGGGEDVAYFFDSTGNDRFVATSTYAKLYGGNFYNYAQGFRYNYAYATAGGTDVACFYDSAGNDRFVATSTYARLYGGNFYNYARGFRYNYAYATAGGTDVAYLYDSAGNDRFVSAGTYARLYGGNFYNYARGFRYNYAYATAGGYDRAYLYDSARNDYLSASRSTAQLKYASGTKVYLNKFDWVSAISSAGGRDTRHVSAVDFVLKYYGTWKRV